MTELICAVNMGTVVLKVEWLIDMTHIVTDIVSNFGTVLKILYEYSRNIHM